jgi:hypothetical protein
MATSPSRRQTYLLVALGLAVAFWLWRSWNTDAPQAKAAAARAASAKKELAVGKAPVVHMELLEKAVVKYDPDGRDLFKYSTRPPSWGQVRQMRAAAAAAAKAQKIAEEQARLAEIERQKKAAELAAYNAAHPQPPPPPQPPVITFKFLGFVGPPSDRIAAFEENEQTFVAKTGEIVKQQFRIDEIKYESVVVSFVNPQFKGQIRELPLMRGK